MWHRFWLQHLHIVGMEIESWRIDTVHISHFIGWWGTAFGPGTGRNLLFHNSNEFVFDIRVRSQRWDCYLDRWLCTRFYPSWYLNIDAVCRWNVYHGSKVSIPKHGDLIYKRKMKKITILVELWFSFSFSADVPLWECSYALAKLELYLGQRFTFICRLHQQKLQPLFQPFSWRYHLYHQWY